MKNKYIKRLLIENEAHKDEINRQNEQILMLNISLKQTSHKLNQAIVDLTEQKQRNHMNSGDMSELHVKLTSVRDQMTRIEEDKQTYTQNILHLGDEIHKKINQWNDLLKLKYQNADRDDDIPDEAADIFNERDFKPVKAAMSKADEESRFEVSVLSQAIAKRNAIITEMEALLIDLTTEISQSATVINRICKNLSQRETNLSSNLEKLRNHLARLLDRPGNSLEYTTQTNDGQCAEGKSRHKTTKRRTSKKIAG